MRTPAEEAEYQRLGKDLGFFSTNPVTTEEPTGFMGFLGQSAANILPSALEKIAQPMAAFAGGGRTDLDATQNKIPRFFDTRAPQGVGEHIVAGGAELLSYLPAIAMTEGLGASALTGLGASARAAKIGGSALGFAYPSAPQGPESAALQGGVGALQTAAMDWGWRGKLAAGVIGGGAGYYEGQKQSPEQGMMMAGLNLLGPTLIDPIVNKMLGANKAAAAMGKEGEDMGKAIPPHMPMGNAMQDAFDQMTDVQKRAHIQALTDPQGAPGFVGPQQPQAGFFGDFSVNPGGGQPLIRNPIPPLVGDFEGGARTRREGMSLLPPLEPEIMGTGSQFAYGRGMQPYNAFASLQPAPIARTEGFMTGFEPRMGMSEAAGTSGDIYGGQGNVYDIFGGTQQAPSTQVLSPREKGIQQQTWINKVVESPTLPSVSPKIKPVKLASGLQKLLTEDVGWTPEGQPLGQGFTKDAFNLGRKFKTTKDVDRARKAEAAYSKLAEETMDTATSEADLMKAQEYANRKQYFSEAIEYATGDPPKVATFRRHDPDYVPNLPSSAWTDMMSKGLDAPVPKAGENYVHWTEDGGPMETTVHKVTEEGVVHYDEHNFMTGQVQPKVASLQEFDLLQKHPQDRPTPNPPKPVEPAAVLAPRRVTKSRNVVEPPQPARAISNVQAGEEIRIKGRFGVEPARVISREGDTLHVEVNDPIFGKRQTSINAGDVLPSVTSTEGKGTVPFKDVQSQKLHGNEGAHGTAHAGEGEADLLGSADEEYTTADVEKAIARMSDPKEQKAARAYWKYMQIEEKYGGNYGPGQPNKYALIFADEGGSGSQKTTRAQIFDDLLAKEAQLFQYKLATKGIGGGIGHQGYRNYWEQSGAAISQWQKEGIDLKKWMKENAKYLPKEDVPPRLKQRPDGLGSMLGSADDNLTLEGDIETKPHFAEVLTSTVKKSTDNELKQKIATAAFYTKHGKSISIEQRLQLGLYYREAIARKLDIPASEILDNYTGNNRLGSVMEGHGPMGSVKRAIKGSTVLEIDEALKYLPKEAAAIIGDLIHRIQEAAGRKINLTFARNMPGSKGGMYEASGNVALNLQWVNAIVKNWDKMSPTVQANSAMRFAALLGHEITHIAHKFGERSQLLIDGQPITKVVMEKIAGFTQQQREYISKQIQDAKGEPNHVVSKYLSGDVEAVHAWYSKRRPGLTMEQATELAAGEVLAEIGSVELIKRMEVQGLPDKLREVINKFKEVIVNVIKWFKGQNMTSEVAGLQKLSEISNLMFDHFKGANEATLKGAFPSSQTWHAPATVNPFTSVKTAPPTAGSEVAQPFIKKELARLGVRAVIGAGAGGLLGPKDISTSEAVIAGGILGAFGPMVVKTLMNKKVTGDLIAAAKAMKGGPFASLKVLMQGKTLRQLGEEGTYGLRGDGSWAAKIVRMLEAEFNLHLDPKIKAIIEQARGIMGEQFAIVENALKKARWIKPSQGVRDATENYIEGKIDKDMYRALLQDDAAKQYGEFMIAAREATSVATDLIAQGMRKSQLRDAIIKNREDYVMRSYKAYRDGDFDMKYFDKVKKDLMDANLDLDDANAEAILREHMVEVKANRRMFSDKRGTGAQAIDSKLKFRRLATEEEIFMQQLEVGAHEHNPFGQEYKKAKASLDWMETHKITDNWRGWLGEIKDPTERMLYTFQKVYPSSIAGKIFDLFDNGLDSIGNKFAMTAKELTNSRELLKEGISKGGPEVASLQRQLDALDSYTPLPEGAAYGKLSGKFTDRFVRDQIATYDTPYKWMDQPVLRGISAINNAVKISRTVLNPITAIRNYLQVPMFMLIGRATPRDVWKSAQVLYKGADPELLSLMRRRHILGVDYAAQELTTNLGNMVSGYFDADAATRIARAGYDKAREIYQQPDMLQRAGTFIAARERFAKRMELDINDPRVTDAAVDWTDRFTMNYSAVPRVVKAARQLPFVSLFVSYASEITRILKNLSVEAISGKHLDDRMHAVGILAGMAALPALLTTAFESNLSAKDQKDWQKLRQLQPDYARSRFYLPLSRDSNGQFHYMDITAMIPADNYTQMMKAAINGDPQSAIAANPIFALQDTPLLNIATEQISGKDLRTGRDVSGLLGRSREVLKEILPPIVPPGYEGERLARAFSRNEQGGWGLTNIRTGVVTRPSDIISNYLTGIRFSNVNLASVQKQAISEAQQQVAHEQQLLRDIINTNITGAQKVEARNRYNRSVTEIMTNLHQRISP